MNKWTGLLWALLSCIYVQYRRTIDKLKQDACFLQPLCQYSSAKWPRFHLSLNSCWQNEMHPSITFIMELKDNSKLPFLGMVIITKTWRSTWTNRYWAWCQEQTSSAEDITLNWAFKLSSTWQFFHQGCERLKKVSARLQLSWHCRREHHQTLYWHEDYWECMF